jgi:hypothetical protein
MADLTAKFTALEELLASQAATTDGFIDTVEEKLQAIFDELDTVIINNAANTKALLAAIGQNSPCAPCPTPSITVPPTGTTTIPIDSDACKRAQAILQMLATVCEALDNLMNLNVSGSWTLLSDVYGQTIDTLGASDTIPLPSFPEAVNIAGDYFSFAASRLFSGETLSGLFAGIRSDLQTAIYSAGSPDAAQSAFGAVIDGSGMSTFGKLMLKAMAYNELWTYFISTTSTPDLTGFSGDACSLAITSCVTLTAVAYTSDVPSAGFAIIADIVGFERVAALATTGGTFTFTPALAYAGNLQGWSWLVLTPDVTVHYQHRLEPPDSANIISDEDATTVTPPITPNADVTGTFIFFASDPFQIQLCPPE